MPQPNIRIHQSGGQGLYLTLNNFDVMSRQVTFTCPDSYTQEFIGEWPGHRLAIVKSANNTLIRYISFSPSWDDRDLALELTIQSFNLDGTGLPDKVKHQFEKRGDKFVFNSSTELGLSYTVTRMA